MIRKWVYREHYYPNLTTEVKEHWELHTGKNLSYKAVQREVNNVSLSQLQTTALRYYVVQQCATVIQLLPLFIGVIKRDRNLIAGAQSIGA